jgi:hypothetical protein
MALSSSLRHEAKGGKKLSVALPHRAEVNRIISADELSP